MTDISSNLIEIKNKFIDNLKNKRRSTATILAYNKDIQQLIDFLIKQKLNSWSEVKNQDLVDFLKSIASNFSQKTISRKINALKTFSRFLVIEKVINEDLAASISHPKYENKPPRILTKLEYRALRDVCRDDTRTYAITELLLQTGLRISELTNLKLTDIKNGHLVIKAFESHFEREVILNKAAKTALDRYLLTRGNSKFENIFITKTGRPLLIRNIRSTLDRFFKEAGIVDACVNDLRHTFIFYQLLNGASISLVSKLVGHKRITTTKKYLELIKNEVKEKTRLKEL